MSLFNGRALLGKFGFSRRTYRPGEGGLPIIIGGCYRSGTTLLRRLLDSHSAIHCGPEVKFFRDFYGDYPEDELKHLRYFSTVRSLGLSESEALAIMGGGYIKCLEYAAAKSGKARWADKNPENVLYLTQWQELLDDRFHFVLVVRHPLDTLASLCEVGFEKTVPRDFAGKVETYRAYTCAGLDFIKKHPERSSLVKYEDLVNNPQKALTELLAAVGEKFEDKMLLNFNSKKRGRGIEDPKIKFTKNVHANSIGRWQSDLDASQQKKACDELIMLFKKLDYPAPVFDV